MLCNVDMKITIIWNPWVFQSSHHNWWPCSWIEVYLLDFTASDSTCCWDALGKRYEKSLKCLWQGTEKKNLRVWVPQGSMLHTLIHVLLEPHLHTDVHPSAVDILSSFFLSHVYVHALFRAQDACTAVILSCKHRMLILIFVCSSLPLRRPFSSPSLCVVLWLLTVGPALLGLPGVTWCFKLLRAWVQPRWKSRAAVINGCHKRATSLTSTQRLPLPSGFPVSLETRRLGNLDSD